MEKTIKMQNRKRQFDSTHGIANSIKNFNCNVCTKRYVSHSKLNEHIEYIHEGKKENKCASCAKCFATVIGLNAHKARIHADPKYLCDSCERSFNTTASLRRHINSVHEGQKVDHYKCICYVIVFIVSYHGITNSRFSLTQSKPCIF